jgi:uracil-DNA glycosylase
MNSEERREIWEGLGLIEDWLGGGARSAPAPLPDVANAAEGLEAVALEIEACRGCRLCETRTRSVPGQGSHRPLAMIVGEGPGAEEDAQGLPFVGPAGKLLDKMLASIGLSRQENCFIANVVKCRPPQNRDPAPDEQAACLGYLRRQIALLRPQDLLCVGRIAAQALLGTSDGVGRMRGAWRDFEGLPLLVTYHPSALLRDDSYKRPAWEDLKLFRERLSQDS